MALVCPPTEDSGPLLLSAEQDRALQKLGYRLNLFQRAAGELYYQSVEGKQPAWVAEWLDRSSALMEGGRPPSAEILLPEVALTEEGFKLVEISHAARDWPVAARLSAGCVAAGFDVIGGAEGWRGDAPPPVAGPLAQRMWLAFFWLRPLRAFWRRELSDRQFAALRKAMPLAWLIDPATLPPHAVVPWLEVNAWDTVALFGPERRASLLLRPSDPASPAAPVPGALVGAAEWREGIHRALAEADRSPWILQQTFPAPVRLWPQYALHAGKAELRGVLARVHLPGREERVTVAAVQASANSSA